MKLLKFWFCLAVIGSVLGASSCDCKGKGTVLVDEACQGVLGQQVGRDQTCSDSTECADHHACAAAKNKAGILCCVFADRKCETEADCCPGQTCNAGRKKCFDKWSPCENDLDCGDTGDRFCEVYSDSYGTSKRCKFKPCGPAGVCPEGQSCFQNECLAGLPCKGECEGGKGCVTSSDSCQDYAVPTGRPMAACPMTCKPGFIATFKDPKNIWDSCDLPAVACVCAELPGLKSEDLGRFSAIAAVPGKALYVSHYDGHYGDTSLRGLI